MTHIHARYDERDSQHRLACLLLLDIDHLVHIHPPAIHITLFITTLHSEYAHQAYSHSTVEIALPTASHPGRLRAINKLTRARTASKARTRRGREERAVEGVYHLPLSYIHFYTSCHTRTPQHRAPPRRHPPRRASNHLQKQLFQNAHPCAPKSIQQAQALQNGVYHVSIYLSPSSSRYSRPRCSLEHIQSTYRLVQ